MQNERYPSKVQHRLYPEAPDEQEQALANDPFLQRFALSRRALADEPYRPAFHFICPESWMNDPNGLCFWQGRWHLFYQAFPPEEFVGKDFWDGGRVHWGHAVSDDLIRWRDLPYAIFPGLGVNCASGTTVVDHDRVIAFYPSGGAGQMVDIATDPLLLNWRHATGSPLPFCGDGCIWKHGGTFYGLIGAADCYPPGVETPHKMARRPFWTSGKLYSSRDLATWTAHGEFIERSPLNGPWDDGACPNFHPIGDKSILLFFSHANGAQYFLGDVDYEALKFTPCLHGRFNHANVAPGGVHAPTAFPDGQGGLYAMFNFNDSNVTPAWDQLLSLPMRLSLDEKQQLRIEPVDARTALRAAGVAIDGIALPANREIVLDGVGGNGVEYELEIETGASHWVRLDVLRSPCREEATSLYYYPTNGIMAHWYPTEGELCLDTSMSSLLPGVPIRPPERAKLFLARGETLKLNIFIDRSVIEVFANGRQYVAMRVYPTRKDSIGVSAMAHGSDGRIRSFKAWQMKAIWPA